MDIIMMLSQDLWEIEAVNSFWSFGGLRLGLSSMRSCISLRPDPGQASAIPVTRLLMRVPSIQRAPAVTGWDGLGWMRWHS